MPTPTRPTPPPPLGPIDADLVRACAAGDRATAFAELVRRHGRTVLAVCRGVLGDGADADDAFQATFLVLLQRAGQVRQPEAVGGWLCGVAAKVARRARQRRANTRTREVTMAADTSPTPAAADPAVAALDRDAQAVVWAELGELPDKYRRALVLCHFDELTTEQAAAVLRCPVGTLRSRLVKGRELLRSRLVRRGVTVTAAALLVLLLAGRASAAPPPELVRRTTSAAAGGSSPAVIQLADRANRDLSPRWPLAATAVGLLVVAVVTLLFAFNRPTQPPAVPTDSARLDPASLPPGGPGTLLVVSQQDATVSLIDPSTGRTRATITTDPCPHEVAVSPNGRLAAAANYGLPFGREPGGTVTLIDVAAGKKLKTVNVGGGAAPHGVCWLTDERLLCTVEKAEAVVEIDAALGKIVRTLQTTQGGTHTVVGSGDRAFTANVFSGTVSSLDLNRGVALTHRRVGRGPEGIAASPDGTRVWVANRADDTITVLNADDLRVIDTIQAPGMPLRMAFTPDGKTVAVVAHLSGELVLFDAGTFAETRRIKMGEGPVRFADPKPAAVAITPDGRTAYCTIFPERAVAVVDLTTGVVTGKFDVPGGAPDGIAFSPINPDEDDR
jgi:RNA polymerase sigma factor (sigma-70 family)